MQSFITIIAPYSSPLNIQFYLLLLGTAIGLVFSLLLMTKRILQNHRLRSLLGMLLGFASFVTLGTVVFSFVHSKQITPIDFQEKHVTFGSEQIAYQDIDRHYIKPLIQQSRYSSQINTDTSLVFVIERRDKKVHLFSNDYYDLRKLRDTCDKYIK